LENFAAYQPRRVTFKSVKQRRVPRGRSSKNESLQNEETFGSFCLGIVMQRGQGIVQQMQTR